MKLYKQNSLGEIFYFHYWPKLYFGFKGEVQKWDRGRSSINNYQKWFFVFLCDVFKVYLSNIDSETAEIFF